MVNGKWQMAGCQHLGHIFHFPFSIFHRHHTSNSRFDEFFGFFPFAVAMNWLAQLSMIRGAGAQQLMGLMSMMAVGGCSRSANMPTTCPLAASRTRASMATTPLPWSSDWLSVLPPSITAVGIHETNPSACSTALDGTS